MLKTKDGQEIAPQNDEELFYSLANNLFVLVGVPPIEIGGSWNEAVLKMQQVLVEVEWLRSEVKFGLRNKKVKWEP